MNHLSHVLFLILKICQNPNPGNAQVKDITLAARIPTHKGKQLDTFSTFRPQSVKAFSIPFQYVSLLVGLQPPLLSTNITEMLSRKPELLHFQNICTKVHAYTVLLYQNQTFAMTVKSQNDGFSLSLSLSLSLYIYIYIYISH